ncbi:PqqD family protein [uncultured Thiocystis sp.]|jgi:hypothetical protein|uniref:PqqD family protein n=1 Tax=uncultured Thiocystis sp. TaxID=1202134 RepID=UPI0025E96E81|nr:PqqD family protein [uncultured Thiocystis sp.]
MDPLSTCFQHQQQLEVEDTGDELLIYRTGDDSTYYLNGTAALVWRLCDGQRRGADIVDLLVDAYPDESVTIRSQVPEILRELTERGVVASI